MMIGDIWRDCVEIEEDALRRSIVHLARTDLFIKLERVLDT